MNRIKALAERWIAEANQLELAAIRTEERDERASLDLKIKANRLLQNASELEVALLEQELDDNPILEQTPSRS